MLHLLDAFCGVKSSDSIVNSEKDGQRQLVESSQIPIEGIDNPVRGTNITARRMIEKFGGKIIGPTPGDKLFYDVRLPKGWSFKETDHAMWSKLIDEKGRVRASIFYKAAFYDRSAHISICSRFLARNKCVDYSAPSPKSCYAVVTDSNDNVVWRGKAEVEETPERMREIWKVDGKTLTDRLNDESLAVLTHTCPDHNNPYAYWDIEPAFPPSSS